MFSVVFAVNSDMKIPRKYILICTIYTDEETKAGELKRRTAGTVVTGDN